MDDNLGYFGLLGKYVLLIRVNSDNKVERVSDAWSKYVDIGLDSFLGKAGHEVIGYEADSKEVLEIIRAIAENQVWRKEIKYTTKFGNKLYFNTQIIPTEDRSSFIIHQEDITDKKELKILSITDELSNLYNRRHFNIILNKLIAKSSQNKTSLGLLILDIDHFKKYNDTCGHPAGDRAIRKMGQIMKKTFKDTTEYLFRLGGEEFGVLFSNTDETIIRTISEKFRQNIEDMKIEHKKNTASKYITASMGLVIVDFENENIDASGIYSMADHSLYQAKEQGRNCIVCHENEAEEWF